MGSLNAISVLGILCFRSFHSFMIIKNIVNFRNINIFLEKECSQIHEDNPERWAPWMLRENHPNPSHHTIVADSHLRVWCAYDSNSEEVWRNKLAVFWGYVILHLKKWKMDYDIFFQLRNPYNKPCAR